MKKMKYERITYVDGSVKESWSIPVPNKKLNKSTLRILIDKFVASISHGGSSQPPMLPPP